MVPEEANGVAGPAGTPHTVGPGTVGVGVFELVWVGVGKTVAAGVVVLAAVLAAVPEGEMPVDGAGVCDEVMDADAEEDVEGEGVGVPGCGASATPLYSVLPHARAMAVAVYVYVSNLTIKLPAPML